MSNQELIDIAIKAKENSYSPYSVFPVGSALITKSGKVYMGTNIENSSYGATMCAERSAIFSAISNGDKDFEKIVIVSNLNDYIYPCCNCRQVMTEFFDKDTKVLMVNSQSGEYLEVSIDELVPYKFGKEQLENV